jgi:hypothetical protein
MAILQAILAEILNYIGTILNTTFGWATTMLFGKVPKDRQLYVTLSSIGAVIWLITLLGIAFPAVAVFIFSFVKIPSNTRLSLSSGAIIELRQTPGTTTAEPNEQG